MSTNDAGLGEEDDDKSALGDGPAAGPLAH